MIQIMEKFINETELAPLPKRKLIEKLGICRKPHRMIMKLGLKL
jgi:hypothetical protein